MLLAVLEAYVMVRLAEAVWVDVNWLARVPGRALLGNRGVVA